MKLSRSFLFAALTAVALAVSADRAASAPAGFSAADWAGLQQLAPSIVQQAYLKASVPSVNDAVGWSVAVSGDTVVIGAPYEFGDPSWVNGNPSGYSAVRAGAAYVFVRNGTNWTQQAYLKASNAESNDWFGVSVAVSDDTLVVGAYGESSNATGINGNQDDNNAVHSGAAYVFVRNGTNWSQQAYLKASNAGGAPQGSYYGDLFGYSVAVSDDTVVVGSLWEGSNAIGVNGNQDNNSALFSGAAYVFARSGTNWSQQAYLKASNTGPGDEFGASLSLSADTLVVGATKEDGNATGVNGNPDDNSAINSGAAYVFVRNGTNWSQQAYLKASNTGGRVSTPNPGLPPGYDPGSTSGDEFGFSVSVSGGTVVVGAPKEDSNATGVDGNQSDNSSVDSGAAYVFVRDGTNWSQQAYLKASNAAAGDFFGVSLAVSGDTVVTGAHLENNSAFASGAAYLFARSVTNWSQQAHLKASNAGWSDRLGWAVAVSGDTVVAGAMGESSNATGVNGDQSNDSVRQSGAAYIFAPVPVPPDSDGDGVIDAKDECPNTPAGAITDASGCSIAQLAPCDGPWRNHGEYVRALHETTSDFIREGLLTEEQRRAIIKQGVASGCGRN